MITLLASIPQRAWRILAWLGVVAVLKLSLMRIPVPEVLDELNADKLVHMAMYGSLMLCFSRGYARRHWLMIAVALGVLGLTIEYLQSLTPYRTASLADEIANLCGISIMLVLVRRSPLAEPQEPR
jgi:VanZ family protein